MSRADKWTPTTKKRELYSDFTINLDKHPVTKNLAKYTNERAVAMSMRNLLLTRKGERFYSDVAGDVERFLFEPIDFITTTRLEEAVKNTLRNYEPRVNVIDVSAVANEESNAYSINIVFSLLNRSAEKFSFTVLLKRAR